MSATNSNRLRRHCHKAIKSLLRPVVQLARRARAAVISLPLAPARRRRRARLVTQNSKGKKVTLFLAPESGLDPFMASHALLARVVADAGHSAVILSCNGMQPTCSVKFAMQIDVTKSDDLSNAACTRCRMNAFRVGEDYDLVDLPLELVLDLTQQLEIKQIMAANAHAPWNTVYDDIGFGRACLGETLRARRKVAVEEFSSEDQRLLVGLLHSSLAIYFSLKVLASRFEIARIVYFGDYAYFIPPQIFAARHNIPLTNISHAYNRDIDRRYLNLRPGHGYSHMMSQVDQWDQYCNFPITEQLVADIADGAIFRLFGHGGASTYSPNWVSSPGDLLDELGLPPGGKVLVAFSNSTDELHCNREILRVLGVPYEDGRNAFVNQVEWLHELVEWVSKRADLRLIIRLHPRMAVSHRHATVASEYAALKAMFAFLPPNVAVVEPHSPLSSYNIAELADVVLTAWSSIGLELARFGLPVVAAFQRVGPFPNADFSITTQNADDYFSAIEVALVKLPTIESVLAAFRWTHFLHWAPLIDISDITPTPDYPVIPPYKEPKNRDLILQVLMDGKDLLAINMHRLPTGSQAKNSERQAIVSAITNFIFYFMTGAPARDTEELRVEFDPDAASASSQTNESSILEVKEDHYVVLRTSQGVYRRRSSIVGRLARSIASMRKCSYGDRSDQLSASGHGEIAQL